MIIDMHSHLWREDMPSTSWWDSFVKVSASLSGRPEEKIRQKLPGWMDGTGDLLIQDMDEAGIDKSVILPIDYVIGGGTGMWPLLMSSTLCMPRQWKNIRIV